MDKKTKYFDTSHLSSDLKGKSLRSGAVALTSQGAMFLIQLGSTMILARILRPQDYGIIEMAAAVTGFAGMFSSLGLSAATVQRPEISHEQVSTLFWINAGIGAIISLIVAAFSPAVAGFYQKPELVWVTLALSSSFFIGGLAVQHFALLTRQMRFYSLAKIQVFSMLAGVVAAYVAASHGFGYWALVLNTLTGTTMNTFGAWIASGWIPGLPRRKVGLGSMLKFGSDLVGFNVVNYFARNLDNIVIGRYQGSAALGLYSKAYQMLMMPITNLRDPLTSVALPALSRIQNDPELYRNYYLKCISLLSFVSMPLVIFMFVTSDQLIALLLGAQWHGASKIFKILAIAALFQPVSSTAGIVLISTKRTKSYLVLGIVNAIITCSSFIAGLPWGTEGVATGYAVANYLFLFPTLSCAFKGTSISLLDFIYAVTKPLIASFLMGGGLYLFLNVAVGVNMVLIVAIGFLVSGVLYLLTFALCSGGTKVLKEYYSYVLLLFEKKKH